MGVPCSSLWNIVHRSDLIGICRTGTEADRKGSRRDRDQCPWLAVFHLRVVEANVFNWWRILSGPLQHNSKLYRRPFKRNLVRHVLALCWCLCMCIVCTSQAVRTSKFDKCAVCASAGSISCVLINRNWNELAYVPGPLCVSLVESPVFIPLPKTT